VTFIADNPDAGAIMARSRILQGAREALAYARSDASTEEYIAHTSKAVDVRASRRKLGLSQKAFSARYGFSFGCIRDWEQGRSSIDTPSRLLLKIIETEPEAVERALALR
jgi:putative transcriptional regulator